MSRRSTRRGARGGAAGEVFDIGIAAASAPLRSIAYFNGAAALDAARDTGALGSTGVVLDRLKFAELLSDTVFLGHIDRMADSATYNGMRLDADGDVFLRGVDMTIIATTGFLLAGASTRIRWGATGIGLFGVAEVARSTGWTITNPSTLKTLDVATATLPQVAQMLGTVVDYLKLLGPLGA
jgi:hypothetical protein